MSDIASIHIDIPGQKSLAPAIRQEREQALDDLKAQGVFRPLNGGEGPFALTLGLEDNRLMIRITDTAGAWLPAISVSLKPYRRIIRDYFLVVESYEKARTGQGPASLEAVDMGRRGLHNEGADLLKDRISDQVAMDFETARRLFTLICVLHIGQVRGPW